MAKISLVRRRLEHPGSHPMTSAEMRAQQELSYGQMVEANTPGADFAESTDTEKGQDTSSGNSLRVGISHVDESALEGVLGVSSLKEGSKLEYGVTVLKRRADLIFNFWPPESPIKMLSAKETSAILDVSLGKIYHLIKAGILKAYKVGRSIRVNFEDILDYLAKAEITPEESKSEEA